jgi:hypothetical protein
VNLGLALLLATVLVAEIMGRAQRSEAPAPAASEAAPLVVTETPGRRSRRMEAKMALETARRRAREPRASSGAILVGPDGLPLMD